MTIRPAPWRPGSMCTTAPSRSADRFRGAPYRRRTRASPCDAPRVLPDSASRGPGAPFRAPTARRRPRAPPRRIAGRSASASNARAWPISSAPASRYSCTGFASALRRSRFVTALRERPTAFAAVSCVSPNSSIRRCSPLRLLERIQVLALDVLDQRDGQRRLVGNVLARARESRAGRPAAPRASGVRRRRSRSGRPRRAARGSAA